MARRFRVVPTWSQLRKLGQSRLAKATILIPVVGYFVIFNQTLAGYLHLIPGLNAESSQQIDNWSLSRLVCLYIGLFCFGLASVIFLIFCPDEILDNSSDHEFIGHEIEIMSAARFERTKDDIASHKKGIPNDMRDQCEAILKHTTSDTVGAPNAVTAELRGHGLTWPDWINRNKAVISDALFLKYFLLDISRWDARAITAGFYLIGTIFLLIPSGEVFVRSTILLKQTLPPLFH